MYPEFYSEDKFGKLFYTNINDFNHLRKGKKKTPNFDSMLLLIDNQIDFCHEKGALAIDGAIGDLKRTGKFILNNIDNIEFIVASLDSHYLYQVFFPSWWTDENGNHPEPFTIIDETNIHKWKPFHNESYEYVKRLKENHNLPLCIWPYHTMEGSIGKAIDPALYEIIMYHYFKTGISPFFATKGSKASSEMYGIFKTEVETLEDLALDVYHVDLADVLKRAISLYDKIFIGGQASSHCVLMTIIQLMELLGESYYKRIYILEDCMSPVKHPEIDFAGIVQNKFEEFKKLGLNIVKSTDKLF